MAIVGIAFVGLCAGPALGGYASNWDWSDGSVALALSPFSLAALISFCLAVVNLLWLATRFGKLYPLKKSKERATTAGNFPDRKCSKFSSSQHLPFILVLYDLI